jgi:hypothetical protein
MSRKHMGVQLIGVANENVMLVGLTKRLKAYVKQSDCLSVISTKIIRSREPYCSVARMGVPYTLGLN